MTAAGLLRELYSINVRLEEKKKKKEELWLLATSNGGIRYDKDRVITSLPQEGGFENKVIDVAILCDEIQKDIDRLAAKYEKGLEVIERVPNPLDRTILELIYVDGLKPKVVAERLHYTDSNIYYHRKNAMERLEKIFL